MSLRRIYYRLSPPMRLMLRKIVFAPFALLPAQKYSNGLKTPARSLIFTGGGDFKETGERFLSYFIKHGLQSKHNVLDIGSGMGRMALPLSTYLEGNYTGIDIMNQAVQWCNKNISKDYPNFEFKLLDVKNDLYRSNGANATSVRFPIESRSKNYCILISVFTHMLPNEVDHYLSEINRCLDKGAICFATFFIYEDEKVLLNNEFEDFHVQDKDHALMDVKVKGANVAFNLTFLKKIFDKNGFGIKYISEGRWQNEEASEDFQDFVVLEKI